MVLQRPTLSVGVHVARAVAVVVAVDFADSYVVGCERVVMMDFWLKKRIVLQTLVPHGQPMRE